MIHILHLKNIPIFQQLQLEEALLRNGDENICLINQGSPPAIVMGISGKAKALIDLEKLAKRPLPVIKRYSGGGTVAVDRDTLFVSWICNKTFLDFQPYPELLMRWSAEFYKCSWPELNLSLRENDYTIGEKKIGGNAQYLTKSRFVHHTTFLWDYHPPLMDLLLHPTKTPKYRQGRAHSAFLAKIKDHFDDRGAFVDKLKCALCERFNAREVDQNRFEEIVHKDHRKSTLMMPCCSLI